MNFGVLRRKLAGNKPPQNDREEFDETSSLNQRLPPTSPTTTSFLFYAQTFFRESLLFPLMCMYFVMLLINTILRDTKDTMLVNSVAGVSAIPILKSWVTIPTSFAFFFAYSRLAHAKHISPRSKFVIILFAFAIFFTIFALVIYPLRKFISPRAWAQSVRDANSGGEKSPLATFASTIEEWTLGLFYVICELWSSAVCQLLFWGVANDVMTIREAKESYPIIGAMGNAGLVVAGQLLLTFADRRDVDSARAYLRVIDMHHQRLRNGENITTTSKQGGMDPMEAGWAGTLFMISMLMCVSCVFITVCYDDVYRRQRLYKQKSDTTVVAVLDTTEEPSMTTWEAIQFLSKSAPLRLVTILVSSYGVSSSLIEVSWKGQVKRAFESTGEYSRFMGSFWTWTGLSSMACMVLSSAMLHRLGYRVAVMFTPFAMMCAGGLFFAVAVSVSLGETGEETALLEEASKNTLSIAAYAGAIAVLVSKSAKYAVFDATKEMVFIPLDAESRSVGKAAIDVVAYRLSKSGGSFVLQFVLIMFGNLEDSGLVPIAALFVGILLIWMRAAFATGKMVHEAQRAEIQQQQHAPPPPPTTRQEQV